jgi:hypothetical protein
MATENWSFGVWFNCTGVGAPNPTDMNTLAASCLTAFGTFWTAALKGSNAAACVPNSCKAYFYDSGALVTSGLSTGTLAAGSGTGPNPGYVARVVTLLTDFSGRSYRGRIYLPWTGAAVSGSTLQWTSNASLLTNLKTMFQAFSTAILALPGPPTNANLAVVGATNATVANVHNLRMDTIPDTQHGRTRRLVAVATDSLVYP